MALNPGMERTQFLLKEFGKSGINLQKFFETGDIVERLNAVNQAMILSDKSIQSVQSYKDALVGLNDSLEGIKLGTGNFLIQPLTAYIDLWLAIPGIVEHGAKAITLSLGGKFEAAHKEMNAMGEDIAPFMIAFEKMFGVEGPEALNRSEDSLMAARNAAFNYSAAIADNTAQQEKNNEISKTFQDLLKGTTPTLEEMAVQAYQTALATDGLFSPEDAAAVVGYQLELGLVTEKEAEAMLAAINLQNVLNAMKDMHVTLTIDEIHNMLAGMDNLSAGGLTPEQYASYIARGLQIPSKGDTSGAGTNGRYTVKANDGTLWYVDDNGWSTTGYKAEGGALGKADIVGEQGWEAVIQGQDGRHVVIPHDMSRWLAAQGLIGAGAGMAGGGVFGGQSGSHTGWASKPFGGVSVPDISTMEAVAPLVDSAAQSSQAANPESTRQIIQQTQIAIAGNDKLLGAVRSMQNAIEGLPEQLAAEIQKRR